MSKPIKRPIAGPRRAVAGSSIQSRKPVLGSRAGTNARPADEGYLYVAGVRDASQRVSEYRVCSTRAQRHELSIFTDSTG
jgi:CDK-activating kinase assembly factor MAT1